LDRSSRQGGERPGQQKAQPNLTASDSGGFPAALFSFMDKVEAGQKVAIQRNSFGEVVAEYTSSVAGEVTGQRSDAMTEPGNPLAFRYGPRQTGRKPGGRDRPRQIVHFLF
jgi:predicted deacylase